MRFLVLRSGHRCVICFKKLRPLTFAWHDDNWTFCRKHRDRIGTPSLMGQAGTGRSATGGESDG
jgi:hypothetical protein